MAKYAELNQGQIEAVVNKLGGMNGLEKFLRGETEVVSKYRSETKTDVLRPLYPSRLLTLPATTGKRTIAKDFNFWGRDKFLEQKNVNRPSEERPETTVQIFSLRSDRDANLEQMFQFFGRPFDELCLTQDQIVAFCENHREHLRSHGIPRFFLFKVEHKFMVAEISSYDPGVLGIGVSDVLLPTPWDGAKQPQIVVPMNVPMS
jgi:hypothetical protein